MTYLVSILSDHLLPNYLFIKEMQKDGFDTLVFISTPKMEKKEKSVALEKTINSYSNIPSCSIKLIVADKDEEDYAHIKQKLKLQNFSKNYTYIINLTGGTKVTVLATYDFFRGFDNAFFYYSPIGANKLITIPETTPQELSSRLNLQEYFSLYGLRFEADNSITEDNGIPLAQLVFNDYAKMNFDSWRYEKIKNAQQLSGPAEKRFYTGGWFEEYLYLRIKNEQALSDDFICKGSKIFHKDSVAHDNEIDIMFIKNNELFIIECKVGIKGKSGANNKKELLDSYLYKLAAIAKDFGLVVKSYLITLENIKSSKTFNYDNLKKRMNILGIKALFDKSDFKKTSKTTLDF